jgi:hypothetical protein
MITIAMLFGDMELTSVKRNRKKILSNTKQLKKTIDFLEKFETHDKQFKL